MSGLLFQGARRIRVCDCFKAPVESLSVWLNEECHPLLIFFCPDTSQGRAPKFVLTPRDQTVVVGEEVFLHCGANGHDHLKHTPRIAWLKDGATVDFE